MLPCVQFWELASQDATGTVIMVVLPGWVVPSTRRAVDIPGGMGGEGPSESAHTKKSNRSLSLMSSKGEVTRDRW